MPWEIVKRDDSFKGHDKPFISISETHIAFNAVFTRIAKLDPGKHVLIYDDPESFKLGFEFVEEEKPDSFKLTLASSDKKGQKRQGLFCSAVRVIRKHSWISAVAKLPDIKDKRFEPTKEANRWVIQLCPAFETRKARESADIPSDLSGIYRYLRESGEIVYIGMGNIKERLSSPGREDWDFNVVEYSKVDNPDQQVKWEQYWIERYKDENNGKLPFYNKVSGIKKGNA